MNHHVPEPRTAIALAAQGVVLGYDDHPVLKGASLTIPRGRRVAVLGANGSGKTTLLRALSGAHPPDEGRVLVDGQPLHHTRAGLREHRQRVQLVTQDPDDQLFSADVTQDISFGPMNLGLTEPEVKERVDEAIALLAIEHLADRPVHRLSHGEAKRVALAGAVAMRPAVVLLDEPTAGLDPAGVSEMLAAMARLEEWGSTVCLSTHEVDHALAWADEAAVVVDGLVRQGPADEVLGEADLLATARLTMPWPLALLKRLIAAGRLPEGTTARTLDEVSSVLSGD
ncbi:energy-coupling factor ABC transporter ATP-binding protein [Janibacter sp. GXQ6167]|uniref:energy-coupling factor ABC transporter ATP-binding protein n=1 Tax=Janibacter sp. GXQ6167 TaxID=3240791 RepID=UPI0035261713